jgi:hypothetical protein
VDLKKNNITLLIAGLKETVYKREVKGFIYSIVTCKRTNNI